MTCYIVGNSFVASLAFFNAFMCCGYRMLIFSSRLFLVAEVNLANIEMEKTTALESHGEVVKEFILVVKNSKWI